VNNFLLFFHYEEDDIYEISAHYGQFCILHYLLDYRKRKSMD